VGSNGSGATEIREVSAGGIKATISSARRRLRVLHGAACINRETSVTSDEGEAPHIMQSNFIAVMGATGNTGRKITETLLKAGQKVRALGRSEEKLAELNKAGAEVLAGDTNDPAFLAKAFHGSGAVYTLLPTDQRGPDFRAEQDRQGEAIVKAIRESGVRYVVALSSVGAHLSEETGVIAGLHAQEERLKKIAGINLLLLRPVSFFENFYTSLAMIKQEGINGDSVAADLAIPMVATRDIAEAAAEALKARDWKGVVVRDLLGLRDLSYSEATRILGERIGKPDLEYVQLSYADEANALVQAGFSESFANLYVEMTRGFNEGTVKPRGRTAENTTPTRFEDFANELARAYAMM
jgi:uncharacterized protein YbjT (DUF2867 family)